MEHLRSLNQFTMKQVNGLSFTLSRSYHRRVPTKTLPVRDELGKSSQGIENVSRVTLDSERGFEPIVVPNG
jgi:hypothetical protein